MLLLVAVLVAQSVFVAVAAQSQVCTVTWWNITNVQSYGPTRRWDITSARACVDYCARTTNCVAVDIDYRHSPVQCWVYTEAWRLGYTVSRYNVVQHRVLSRNCRQARITTTTTTTTTTTPPETCPDWRRFYSSNANGASMASGYVTEADCLSHCVSLSNCVAVDVNWAARPLQCWVHTRTVYYRNSKYGVTHFQLASRCSQVRRNRNTPTTAARTRRTPATIAARRLTTRRPITAARCSPSWRRRDNTHSYGGSPVFTASCSSESGCLSCCVADRYCTGVDIDMRSHPARCFMYRWPDALRHRASAWGINQFELVSRGNCIISTTTTTTTSTSTSTTTTTTPRTTTTRRRSTRSTTTARFSNTPQSAPGTGTCPAGQWMCDIRNCYPESAVCNNAFDCIDLSDERGCAEGCKRNGGISCDNGLCLLPYQRCDGLVDCTDFSDEQRCPCTSGKYQCRNGDCLPPSWRCDGSTDCSTGEDEIGCSCSSSQYRCQQGPCISTSLVCDGVRDCPVGDDESPRRCGSCMTNQFQCRSNYRCVGSYQRCDGVSQCTDASDELLCLRFFVNSAERKKRAAMADTGSYPTSPAPLAAVYRGNNYYYFCSDLWSRSWSDSACRNMGFHRSDRTYFNSASSSDRLLILQVYSGQQSLNFLASFTSGRRCSSNQKVVLNCASKDCGRRMQGENQLDDYIESGSMASHYSWPWHAALLKDGNYRCSATIISARWLLTSARCLISSRTSRRLNPTTLAVRAGSIYLHSHDVSRAQVSRVDRIVLHWSFGADGRSLAGDLALVRLQSSLRVTDSVRPVCVQSGSVGSGRYGTCVVTGWAPYRAASSSVSRQNVLRQVRVTSQPLRHCLARYHSTSQSSLTCVSPLSSNDSCIMNAGAGLVCRDMTTGSWTQVSTATTTAANLDGCASTVFVKISSTLYSWINSVTGTNS